MRTSVLTDCEGSRIGGRSCGKERALPFLTIVQCHLHICFQAEGHVRSSSVLCGENMRAREKEHISSTIEANSLHIETISSEKVERTIARDISNSTAPVKKKTILVYYLS